MVVSLAKECGTQLQGEVLGKKHYAQIWGSLSDVSSGEVVLLDFKHVDVVTGSWINAMIVPLYKRCAEPEIDLYPIICNAISSWLDDLTLISKWTHQCYLLTSQCRYPVKRAQLIGSLEPVQRSTLETVIKRKAVTGAELERTSDEKILATAWNNRLKDLHERRLIKRSKQGRQQVYSPLVEAIELNG